MKGNWKAPYLTYNKIKPIAEDFLKTHNPERIIPVPIEDIVDSDFRISVLPLPNLELLFRIDSYIESSLKTICMDERISRHEQRRRFSIAHEMGHLILHRDFYMKATFETTDEYIDFRKNLNAEQEHWFEKHAYDFAGLVLVPEKELEESFDEGLEEARAYGIEPYEFPRQFLESLLTPLSEKFYVTEHVVRRRIKYDKIWEIY